MAMAQDQQPPPPDQAQGQGQDDQEKSPMDLVKETDQDLQKITALVQGVDQELGKAMLQLNSQFRQIIEAVMQKQGGGQKQQGKPMPAETPMNQGANQNARGGY